MGSIVVQLPCRVKYRQSPPPCLPKTPHTKLNKKSQVKQNKFWY